MKEKIHRVLLIDDDDDDVFFITGYLSDIKSLSFQITVEKNYEKALNSVLTNEHDVCLIDYFLGPHTGLELIKECRTAGLSKPFILISGNRDSTLDTEAKEAGVFEVILKDDLNKNSLEDCVSRAVSTFTQSLNQGTAGQSAS